MNVLSLSEPLPSKDIMITLTTSAGQIRKVVSGGVNNSVPFGYNIVEEGGKGFHDSYNVSYALSNPLIVSNTSAASLNNSVQWFGNYTLKSGSQMSASGYAFKDMCQGVIERPEYLSQGNFTGRTTWAKSDFFGLSSEEWKKIFGDTVTRDDLGSASYVLYFNVGKTQKVTNSDLGQYFVTRGVATKDGDDYYPADKFYASTSDMNWIFGKNSYYGDANGEISIEAGDRVTVSVVHLPSGQTMFTKTVMVEEGLLS